MEETKKTDKEVLSKGIRVMLICLFLMFTGPTTLHIAFSNKEKPLFFRVFSLAEHPTFCF